jgi:hypothetical protein
MVSQPRSLARAGEANATRREHERPPTIAPALDPQQSLPRLLAVAFLTGLVVLLWGLRDGPSASADPASLSTASGAPASAQPQASEIAAPVGAWEAVREAITLTGGETTVPGPSALPANALPRPPEAPDPVQPRDFIRFSAQPGDTIYDVSLVYGVSIDEILRFNPNLGDGTQIGIGQLILVPVD